MQNTPVSLLNYSKNMPVPLHREPVILPTITYIYHHIHITLFSKHLSMIFIFMLNSVTGNMLPCGTPSCWW